MRVGLLMIAVGFVAGVVGAEEGVITPGAMTSWRIVCSSEATVAERYAATEFQGLFAEMTGAVLPIAEHGTRGTGAVYIGPGAVARSGVRSHRRKLGEEGFRVSVAANTVLIDGGQPRGTLYGVYEFFEELCGVRYLTFDHTYYPEDVLSRSIPFGTYEHSPTFALRWSYYGETNRRPAFAARLRNNVTTGDARFGGTTAYRVVSHNVAYLVPPKKYGKEHPEYYALVDGGRPLAMDGGGPQLCMTTPEVLDVVVQSVLDAIEKYPARRNIDIAQMDNGSYCSCDGCAAIDAREESLAGATLTFVNAVAERIEKIHPDVLIGTYAYQYTRKPPKTIRARSNVMIQLCSIECCDFHAIDDPTCSLNRAFCADMAAWQEKADHIFIWHYNTNFRGYMLPFPNLRSIGKSVEYFSKNKGRGVFMQAAGNGFSTELSDLRNYVMSRCLWKPGRDSWKEAEDFCRLHYREAAQPIWEYLTYYHDLVDASGTHPTCFPTATTLCIDSDSARKTFAYFQEALALAESDEVRARVEKASLCAYRAMLNVAGMNLTYDGDVYKPDLAESETDLVEQYAALSARYGVTMETEHNKAGLYLKQQRKLHAGMRAVHVENDVWRVVLAPESNAKIVQMIHKPTGRDIIRAGRAFDRFRFEDWVQQGEGPTSVNILAYEVGAHKPDSVVVTLTTKDGARIERRIALVDDGIRFETVMTAGRARPYHVLVHPEYDAATSSDDPEIVSLYIKNPDWVHANEGWQQASPTSEQMAAVRAGVAGGAFAYYNHEAKFGVEQRFDPAEYSALGLFWNPGRVQVNLELFTKIEALEKGDTARYTYEIRYLEEPPVKR